MTCSKLHVTKTKYSKACKVKELKAKEKLVLFFVIFVVVYSPIIAPILI